MDKTSMILIGVIALLVIVAGVQAFQFSTLTSNLAESSGDLKATLKPSSNSPVQSSSSSQGVLANLPSQVGGC